MQRASAAVSRVAGRRSMATAPSTGNQQQFWALREMGPLGRWMRDQPNTIAKDQAFFAHKEAPTYIAKSSDKFVMLLVGTLMGTGFLIAGKGLLDLLYTTNKKPN